MTTVLRRMVTRTRAPLSSIEPATRPLFASGEQELEPGVAGALEVSADPLPTAPTVHPATRPRPAGKRASAPPSEQADREIAPGASLPARGAPPVSGPGTEGDRPHEPRKARALAVALERSGAVASARPDELASSAPAAPPASPVAPTGSTQPALALPADRPPLPTTVAGANRAQRRRPPSPPLADQPPAGEPPTREPPAASSIAAPEVTISIGHIEVRAAPAPAPARSRPAFRPRVSLEDFLAGRQDGRP